MEEKRIKTGSDFSGVGAFDQACERLGLKQDKKFACDMDKHARQTYILNFGKPDYYPENVYNREVPKESLDIYMTSPPCQAFSNSGKRLGEKDKRGILFYNSHEFIKKNQPRFFIFENVKGLLSDDKDKNNKKQQYGKTFTTWLQYLGGKSINGVPTLFPHEESVNYHVYHKILNAKHYGVPQNRERVFIIGIRDDKDNIFSWPKTQELKKRLINVLEPEVNEKYFLSDEIIQSFIAQNTKHDNKRNGFKFEPNSGDKVANAITTKCGQRITDNFVKIGAIRGRNPENPKSRKSGLETEQRLEINQNGTSNALTTVQKDNVVVYGNLSGGKWDKMHEQSRRVYDIEGVSPAIHTMSGGGQHHKIKVKSANSRGFDVAEEGDSINLEFANSDTRRGRVGKQVAQTLDTGCNQGVVLHKIVQKVSVRKYQVNVDKLKEVLISSRNITINEISKKLNINKSKVEHWFRKDKSFSIPDKNIWFDLKKLLNIKTDEFDLSITTYIDKDNVYEKTNRVYDILGISPTITSTNADEKITDMINIRRLTPLECFRLMDFNPSFKWDVSDTQAYKQAGNSIPVGVLAAIIEKLKL